MDEFIFCIKDHVYIINKVKNKTGCLGMKRIMGFMGNNDTTMIVKIFSQFRPCFFRVVTNFKRFNKMLGVLCLTGNAIRAVQA